MSTAVLLTLEEFIARPEREDWQKEELIEGELIVSPGAKVSHAYVVDELRKRLRSLEEQGFVVSNDFSCILRPRSMPIPDLAVVGRKRRPWPLQFNACGRPRRDPVFALYG